MLFQLQSMLFAVTHPRDRTQAIIMSSGTFWQGSLSLCACGVAARGLAAHPVQCIPPCNKLLVQSPGRAAVGYWLARLQQSPTQRGSV